MSGTPARLVALDGAVAMVSGGAGCIGAAIARTFLEAGAQVACVDLPGAEAPEGTVGLECDLRDLASIPALFHAFRERFDRLDVLVHAAGITRDSMLWKMSPRDWSEVLRVNLDSAFHLLREAAPMMRARRRGSIVLISSINAQRGKPGQANYAASKAGLIGLALTAARELGGSGVRVNVVAPGWIDTAMTRAVGEELRRRSVAETCLGRVGCPEDVAHAVLFLASPMAGHVTGQVLRVDGGQLTA